MTHRLPASGSSNFPGNFPGGLSGDLNQGRQRFGVPARHACRQRALLRHQPALLGLRDYGTPPQVWGGDGRCRHQWGTEGKSGQRLRNGESSSTINNGRITKRPTGETLHPATGAFCRCGAWRGSLGLEPTYQLYVDHLVEVLREVRRVLRPDGTLWLVIGDCYATGGGKAKRAGGRGQGDRWEQYGPRGYQGIGETGFQPNRMPQPGLKPKDLVGIPWRVAFALQDDGWWLRRDNVWHKPNPMPESTKDRCTSSHEYLFHLTKSARYFFDHEAIKEPFATDPRENYPGRAAILGRGRQPSSQAPLGSARRDNTGGYPPNGGGRNKRSVWTIATSPYPGAHFATFPPALVEPCILAGTSARGCCPKCGAGWVRVVEKGAIQSTGGSKTGARASNMETVAPFRSRRTENRDYNTGEFVQRAYITIGWRASCSCKAGAAIPATVLDPFLRLGNPRNPQCQNLKRPRAACWRRAKLGIAGGMRPP